MPRERRPPARSRAAAPRAPRPGPRAGARRRRGSSRRSRRRAPARPRRARHPGIVGAHRGRRNPPPGACRSARRAASARRENRPDPTRTGGARKLDGAVAARVWCDPAERASGGGPAAAPSDREARFGRASRSHPHGEQEDLARRDVRQGRQEGARAARQVRDVVRHPREPALRPERREARARGPARLPRRVPVHPRRAADDVPRPVLDDAPVRRLRHRRGVEQALPLPPQVGADRPLGRVRPPHADGPRLRPPARAAARSARSAWRSTRSRTWRRSSTGSRSARSPRR